MTTDIPQAILELLSRKSASTRIAVIGASNNPEKYGNIIVKNLSGKGYTVLPVNPREEEIAGLSAFSSTDALPDPVHLVNLVTPPKVSASVIENLDPVRFKALWFQDGSFNDAIISRAQERFDVVIYNACIMVVANYP
jgi:uncharacterized protein